MPIQIQDLIDLQTLAESVEVEFKLAGGRDGKGQLPEDFWPSYSAMANGQGGWVILGVKEKHGQFTPIGVTEPAKVIQDLFNQLNDRDRVSVNVIRDEDVQSVNLQGAQVLAIRIPTALRRQKPVHLKKTPYGNTYRRLHEGDRKCPDEIVDRMLAERIYDSRDAEVLSEHYSFDEDINQESLKTYRNFLSAHNPQHPFLEVDLFEFFKKIGGWRKDRETGQSGITLAGLLMFGQWEAITAARPHYFVDYQERPEAITELRWIDRVCPDGTWSGNLFDFYRKVYPRFIEGLKVPFTLKNGQRAGETPVHIAIREALVNTLIHADFSERMSVLVVKRPDMVGFRNPGMMRIPIEEAIHGGVSDCRNSTLQKMFLLIGMSEKAGSGMPKIYSGWQANNWRVPKLWEKIEPPQTILEMLTVSLIPEQGLEQLRQIFGDKFDALDDLEQLVVASALSEGWINHARACQLTTRHTRDVTLALPRLEQKGFLEAKGEHKDKHYTLPGVVLTTPEEVFAPSGVQYMQSLPVASFHSDHSSTHKGDSSTHNDDSSTHNGDSSALSRDSSAHNGDNNYGRERDSQGRLIASKLDLPAVDNLELLSPEFRHQLQTLTQLARDKRRLGKEVMQSVVTGVCQGHYVTLAVLSELLSRNAQSLRQSYLSPMVDQGLLLLAFPQVPHHPKQSYTTASKRDVKE